MPWQKVPPTQSALVNNQDMAVKFYFGDDGPGLRFHFTIRTDVGADHHVDRLVSASPLTTQQRNDLQAALVVLRDYSLAQAGFSNV
jgi:hypothetical protein